MQSGLHAPLSPNEEILLRRVAYGSLGIDVKQLKRLVFLALVDCSGRTVRLTALGRQRFDALPKAPLIATRGIRVGMIVEATLSKFASQVGPASVAKPIDPAPPGPVPVASAIELAVPAAATPIHFDLSVWRERTAKRLIRIRSQLIEHRKQQRALLEGSTERIAISRALLSGTLPRRAVGLQLLGPVSL
jgi:hypothetical protein